MKSLMSVLVVLPTLLATAAVCRAQTAGVPTLKPVLSRIGGYPCDDRRPIEPLNAGADRMPYGPDVPCPDFPGPTNPGPEPLPYPKPHPRPWIEDDAAQPYRKDFERSAAVLNGASSGERAAALATMFDGSSLASRPGALILAGNPPASSDEGVAGIVKERRTRLARSTDGQKSIPVPSPRGSVTRRPGFSLVGCFDDSGCNNSTVRDVTNAIKDGVEIYNRFRDNDRINQENEDRYKKGTEEWNNTHEDHLRRTNPSVG